MSDMQTMPVRDLIASLRDQIKNAPTENAVQLLVLGVLCNRIEEQADLADAYKELLKDAVMQLESYGHEIAAGNIRKAYLDLGKGSDDGQG